jgi:hypothetical protein
MWLRVDGLPYYIGKGTAGRAFRRYSPEPARILIQFWSSEQEALDMEKFYIKLFGRKDNGTGILRNLTDGGEGIKGQFWTPEKRAHHSEIIKKTFTQELRDAQSMRQKGKKRPSWTPERRAKFLETFAKNRADRLAGIVPSRVQSAEERERHHSAAMRPDVRAKHHASMVAWGASPEIRRLLSDAAHKRKRPAVQIIHGTLRGYKRGCHCASCRAANAAAVREWKKRSV